MNKCYVAFMVFRVVRKKSWFSKRDQNKSKQTTTVKPTKPKNKAEVSNRATENSDASTKANFEIENERTSQKNVQNCPNCRIMKRF